MKKLSLLIIAAVLLAANPIPALSQDWNVELLGSTFNFWQTAQAVAVQGDYAYVYTGDTGFSIVNISEVSNPFEEGVWMPSWSGIFGGGPWESIGSDKFVISGNFMYVALGDSGLRIVDLSVPLAPAEVGSWNQAGNVNLVNVTGTYAVVTCTNLSDSSAFCVLDITNPQNPVEIGSCNLPSLGCDMAVADNYAYVTDTGLNVIDITDPANPFITGTLIGWGGLLDISGDYAYLSYHFGRTGNFTVVDISNPSDPFMVSTLEGCGGYKISVNAPYAYIIYGDMYGIGNYFFTIDVSDPVNPVVIDTYNALYAIDDINFFDGYVFIAEWCLGWQTIAPQNCALCLVDVTDPYNLVETGSLVSDGSINAVVKVNNYAYLCGTSVSWLNPLDPTKFWIVDVSDVTAPDLIGSLQTPGAAEDLAIDGNYAYVADGSRGLRVIDIADPANPVELGSLDANDYAKAIAHSDYWPSFVFLADNGLRVVDVSNPANPVEYSYLYTDHDPSDIAVSGNYAYVTLNNYEFLYPPEMSIIDITDPAFPSIVGEWNAPGFFISSKNVDVSGSYAYVITANATSSTDLLRIIDISDPVNPTEVGSYTINGNDVQVSGNYAYIAGLSGLQILDVSNFLVPYEVGNYDTPGNAVGVYALGEYAYVADSYYFDIYDCSEALSYTLSVNVAITPINPPIIIPSFGGSFDFNIAVANNGTGQVVVDVWCDITLPGGSTYGLSFEPVNLTIPGGHTIDHDLRQMVPGAAPAGLYSYNAYMGNYPDAVLVSNSFPFEKLGSGDGAEVGDWNNYGESFEEWMTMVADEAVVPGEYLLGQNYPNPFNPTTTISYTLQDASYTTLAVYDVQGREIATLVNGWRDAGVHEVTFDGSNLPSGVYLYRLKAGNFDATGKMVLVK